jgi:hypothetical protein
MHEDDPSMNKENKCMMTGTKKLALGMYRVHHMKKINKIYFSKGMYKNPTHKGTKNKSKGSKETNN